MAYIIIPAFLIVVAIACICIELFCGESPEDLVKHKERELMIRAAQRRDKSCK